MIHHARKPSDDHPGGGRLAIRGSSAIYDASDSAYVFSANKGDPIRVAHERAKSHGETIEDFALVITDVPIDGDPKGGLALRVFGTELIAQRREAAASDHARRDAKTIRDVLTRHPGGLKTMELRARAGLAGDRFARAMVAVGDDVIQRDERRGPARAATYHYLREHLPDQTGQKPDAPPSEERGLSNKESATFSGAGLPASQDGGRGGRA